MLMAWMKAAWSQLGGAAEVGVGSRAGWYDGEGSRVGDGGDGRRAGWYDYEGSRADGGV